MPRVLVDTSVILDIATEDATWCPWSSEQLEQVAGEAVLCINKIIYAAVENMQLLTRDARRIRDYFPSVQVISPA